MKKWLSIALVVVLCLGMCACGKTKSAQPVDKDVYYGTWACYYTDEEANQTYKYCRYVAFYKGGVGRYEIYNLDKETRVETDDFMWDFVDGCVRTTRVLNGYTYYDSYCYIAETDTIYEVDNVEKTYIRLSASSTAQ